MPEFVDITPASIAQVQRLGDGRLVSIEDDVANVAKDLAALGPFELFLDADQGVFVVMQRMTDDSESLVTTSKECDQRLVARVRQVMSPDYDLVGEIEKSEAQADAQRTYERREQIGEVAERLAHAFKKDLGL
jgi:hypothetical protein